MLEAIQRVNRELGALTVIITHNAVMADMADRVIHLSDGRVHQVRQNPRRAARQHPELVSNRSCSWTANSGATCAASKARPSPWPW